LVKESLPPLEPDRVIELWFEDEARVGQQGTQTRVWAVRGTRPRVIRQQQFLSAYIFGAVCPSADKAIGLILPQANIAAMEIYLTQIAQQLAPKHHAVLVMDRAPWHTTQRLKIPDNITCLFLPAYSPELNPVELVWLQLRQGWLANRCYENYEAIVDACCQAWNEFTQVPQAITQLCSRKWANVEGFLT
jgi:transposase